MLHDEYGWSASKVIAAPAITGTAYLFQFQRKCASGTNRHTDEGIACLIPGRTNDSAPASAERTASRDNVGIYISTRSVMPNEPSYMMQLERYHAEAENVQSWSDWSAFEKKVVQSQYVAPSTTATANADKRREQ